MMNIFFSELKRRNVVRVAIAYAVVSWVVLQFVDIIQDPLNLPDWFQTVTIVFLGIGFPIALIVSWAFEVTPEGVMKTAEVDKSKSVTHGTGQKINKLIIGALGLAVAFLLYDKFLLSPEGPLIEEAEAGPVSIAVLPFSDLSQAGDQEYFGDGVAEEILNILTKVEGLDVTSRTTAFSLKGQGLSIPEMADRLGVSHIVEGSIRSSGNRVRITAQLIKTDTDTHLWSETYDREMTDIFAIQDDISRSITDALQIELFGDGAGRKNPTDNLEAYQLYLQGHHLIMQRGEDNLVLATKRLKAAVELDPDFALAWADLAVGNLLIPSYASNIDRQIYVDQAKFATDRALELDPDLALAVTMKGFLSFHEREWPESFVYLEKARELDPKNETTWLWTAVQRSSLGYLDDALVAAKRAYEIAPTTGINAGWLGFVHGYVGNYKEAHRYLDESIGLGWIYAYVRKTELMLEEGDFEGAKLNLQIYLRKLEEPENGLDIVLEAFQDPTLIPEAKVVLKEHMEARHYYSSLYGSMILGDAEIIIEFLETMSNNWAAEIGFLFAPPYRKVFKDPIFQDYIEEVGLIDFWREHGWPDICKSIGEEDFICE
ncbi:MAG: tetratricopeptide repeat protein [Alphaproteobacteria bacterium]